MKKFVSHDRQDEPMKSKAQWFQSLSLSERMDMLCCFTEMILENNPELPQKKDVESHGRRVRVVSLPSQ